MRLRRLVLARYGKFTDRTVDFGEAVEGAPDLHVIHGPNEAGKSTLLSGYLDLLFGVELQSRYGFLHPYETMRVGGCLELSTGPVELVRVKKPQPTLRGADGQPVVQGLIAGELGGLDRTGYRTMFSLDDETLESGGESILASNGELGQLLFSASAGLAELSRTLLDVRAVADGFTRPNARSGELHDLKAGLARLKQERDAIDTQAAAYASLAKARDDATAAYDAALAELTEKRSEAARVQAFRTALPRMAAWRGFQDRLDAFGDLPVAPASWQAELGDLERAEPRHRSATEQAAAEVVRLTRLLEGMEVDEAALALAGRLAHLDTLAARNLTADLDLPARRGERARAAEAVRGILIRIGRADEADPGTLLLTAAQAARFDELLARRSGIDAKLAAANDELVAAVDDLTEARRHLGPEPGSPPPGALARIEAALAAWRGSDHPIRLRTALKSRDQHGHAVSTHLAALKPWAGDVAALAALTIPDPGTVLGWQEASGRCARVVTQRRDIVERLEGELVPRRAERAAMGAVAGLLGDREAAEVRTAREAAWALHRRRLDAASADAFETVLRHDDLVGAARLRHERDLAKLHETTQVILVKEAELDAARRLLDTATADEERQAALTAGAVTRIDPALAGMPHAAVSSWIEKRNEAVASWAQLRDAERDVADAETDAQALSASLRDALTRIAAPVDPAATPDDLVVAAQHAVDREAKLQVLRRSVAECEKNLRKREQAVSKASTAEAAWCAAWLAACSACWLGPDAATLPLGAVRAVIAATAELGPALDKRAGLDGRVSDMEHDQVSFAQEVGRLVGELGIAADGRSWPDLARTVVDRVQGAVRADSDRKELRASLVEAEEAERKARQAASSHASRVKEMMDVLKAGSLMEIAGKLRDIGDKAEVVGQAADAAREILAALGAGSVAEAELLLAGQSGAALEGRDAGLSAHIGELEQRVRRLFADQQAAVERILAVGGDDAAAVIEERRRTQVLEIEDKAHHYLRLRVGIAAAERALRRYRDQHRSSMMQQASDAFSTISRGAYRGLGTQPGRDGELLVALGADGGSKLAADLSKGTRFQLYLALRAAGYHEFSRLRQPVPFIADDIMETFDDHRAEATLRVLGDMSRLGQVIYLTHHSHLRDIAERTVPGVRLHELAA